MQVVMVATVVAVLGPVVMNYLSRSSQVAHRLRDSASIAAVHSSSETLGQDPGFWVGVMRKQEPLSNGTTNWSSCTSPTTPVGGYQCWAAETNPSITNDPVVTMAISTAAASWVPATPPTVISSANLYDSNRIQIAGPYANPLYFQDNGLPCFTNTSAQCKFRSIGIVLRQNSANNPGNLVIIRRVDQNPLSMVDVNGHPIPNLPVLKPLYDIVNVGLLWTNPAGTGLPVGAIIPWGGNPAIQPVPSGFLLADGTAYSTTLYPELSAALGGLWNTPAPGAGNFRVPNMVTGNLFQRGTDGSYPTPGVTLGSAVQSHGHNAMAVLSAAGTVGATAGLAGTFTLTPATIPAGYLGDPGKLGMGTCAASGVDSPVPPAGPGPGWTYPYCTSPVTSSAWVNTLSVFGPIAFSPTAAGFTVTTGAAPMAAGTMPISTTAYYLIRADY